MDDGGQDASGSGSGSGSVADRVARERHWQRKLGKLMLGAEPLEAQLQTQRRVTWALTIVVSGIGLLFLALFSAFQAPMTGAVVAGGLVLPIVGLAWLRHVILRRRVAAYLREHRRGQRAENGKDVTPDAADAH